MVSKKHEKSGFWSEIKSLALMLFIIFLIRTFGFGLYQVPSGSMETTLLVGEGFFADKLTHFFKPFERSEIISFNSPLFDYSDNRWMRLWQEYVWGPINVTKRIIGLPGDVIQGKIEDGKPVVYLNGAVLNEPYLNKYPLIYVWKEDPEFIKQNLPVWEAQGTANEHLNELLSLKSYDPSKPYNQQPFYLIRPERIYSQSETGIDLIYPQQAEKPKKVVEHAEGENYWDGSDEFYIKLGTNQYWVMGDNRRGSSDSRAFGPLDGRLLHGRIIFRLWSIDTDERWWILDMLKHPIDFWSRVRWSRCMNIVK